jgi:hypothetical protein
MKVPQASDRPYFKSSIAELEALFKRAGYDLKILQALDRELGFRSSDRAQKLRPLVKARLTAPAAKPAAVAPIVRPPPVRASEGSKSPQTLVAVSGDGLSVAATARNPTGAEAILGAWTALEALSPQTYRRPEDLAAGDRSCVAELGRPILPWIKGETSRPKRQLYYQVILGAIPMDRATDDLVRAFGAHEEQRNRAREKAAIGAFLVDRHGVMLEENAVSVSSFAWALPRALKMRLTELGSWAQHERNCLSALEQLLRRTDGAGKPIPIDLARINMAHEWLVKAFGLPDHLVERPSFAIRIFHYFKSRNPPELLLLNSFFLGDLARADMELRDRTAPRGLRQYLGLERPPKTSDLLTDVKALEEAVAPARVPAARWPSPGGHPLVLLQQAAVNLARQELVETDGILAVNGPPGTGKTTLLRDLVAATVFDRAIAMTEFEDPADAFTASGERLGFGGQAFFHLYRLDPSLRGHEILVASSNNKAVENVSRELPAATAIGRGDDLAYFKSVADHVHGSRDREAEADGEVTQGTHWGLIAAVLGNARNRAAFQQDFWWNEESGFRLYLKAAKGDDVGRENRDDAGNIIERRTPAVVLAEQPPSPQEAQRRWRKSCDRLLALKREVDDGLDRLETLRACCIELARVNRQIAEHEAVLVGLLGKRTKRQAVLARREADCSAAAAGVTDADATLSDHRRIRPGFLVRLLRLARWRVWSADNRPLVETARQAGDHFRLKAQELEEARASLASLDSEVARAKQALVEPCATAQKLARTVDCH